ncbi:MAG: ROK family transcriptional regulator [Candidatus Latescibacterota bacterium]
MKEILAQQKKNSVLNQIRRSGPISLSHLSDLIGLDRKSVKFLLDELKAEGLVRQKELGPSTGGRRPQLVELDPEYGIAVGVDIGLTQTRTVAVNIRKELVGQEIRKTKLGNDLVDGIIESIEHLLAGGKKAPLLGIGMAMAGLNDPDRALMIFSPKFGDVRDLPLGKLMGDRFGVPAMLQGNAAAMALGEQAFGVGRGVNDFVCVNMATGIGLGVVINGKLYRGASGYAGELGHIVVEPTGPRCVCGNYGCLEVMASGLALARQTREALEHGVHSSVDGMVAGKWEDITAKIVCEAARGGDKLAYTIIEKAGDYLAMGLATVINLFNPEVIVLSGGLSLACEGIREPITRRLKVHALEMPLNEARIVFSELGEASGALGAATLVLDRVFDPPALS